MGEHSSLGRQHVPDQLPDDEFTRDLHPHLNAGRNYDEQGPQPARAGRTLYDVKRATRRLQGLDDDDLKRIPVLPEGTPLQQGATYLNLGDTNGAPFTAHGEMIAGSDDLYIPKADTDYVLWNRLTGITTPERLDRAPEH
jgi:hypothetical protein